MAALTLSLFLASGNYLILLASVSLFYVEHDVAWLQISVHYLQVLHVRREPPLDQVGTLIIPLTGLLSWHPLRSHCVSPALSSRPGALSPLLVRFHTTGPVTVQISYSDHGNSS